MYMTEYLTRLLQQPALVGKTDPLRHSPCASSHSPATKSLKKGPHKGSRTKRKDQNKFRPERLLYSQSPVAVMTQIGSHNNDDDAESHNFGRAVVPAPLGLARRLNMRCVQRVGTVFTILSRLVASNTFLSRARSGRALAHCCKHLLDVETR